MRRIYVFVSGLMLLGTFAWATGYRFGAATVTTVTPVLIGNSSGRTVLSICNQDATNSIFCGDSTVTTANGMPVKAGLCGTIQGVGGASSPVDAIPVYCVATGGSVDTRYWEDVR